MEHPEMKIHPAAAIMPMMPDDELAELAESIKENGLIHPVMLDAEGQVVDGKNRLAACRLAGVEPRFETLEKGRDVIAYVASVNLQRRHVSKGQQAMRHARLFPEPMSPSERARKGGEAKARGEAACSESKPAFSRVRLSQARTVLRHSIELAQSVVEGTTGLDEALETVEESERQRAESEHNLARLRSEAPELAEHVHEGKMALADAINALDERNRAREERQRAATTLVNQVFTLLNPLSPASPDERAMSLVRDVNLNYWTESTGAEPTVECFRKGAAILVAFAEHWATCLRESQDDASGPEEK
jgi:ParB-like chromosome segregation protein Spo0J